MPFGPCWNCGADSFSGLEKCPYCGAARPFDAAARPGAAPVPASGAAPAPASVPVRTCPRCGAILRPGEALCPDCAREPEVELPSALVPCKACGHLVSPRASSCPHCGDPIAPLPAVAPPPPPPPARPHHRRGVAAALALFLGGLGVHKFYLHRPGLGLLYLLFSWTLIPSVVGVVEAIMYAFSSDEEFERRFG